MVNIPIKAGKKDASCSMFCDPLVTKFFSVVVEGSSGQLAEEIIFNTCRRIYGVSIAEVVIISQ